MITRQGKLVKISAISGKRKKSRKPDNQLIFTNLICACWPLLLILQP